MPVIVEDREMREEAAQRGRLPASGQQMDLSSRNDFSDAGVPLPPQNVPSSSGTYEISVHGATPQQQLQGGQPFGMPGQNMAGHQSGSGQSPGAFRMSPMVGALPEYQPTTSSHISPHEQQRYLGGVSSNASSYTPQQFSGHSTTTGYAFNSHHFASPYQQGYPLQHSPQSQSGGPSPIYSSYPGGAYFPTQQQHYMYYTGQHVQPAQTQHGSFPPAYNSGYLQQSADTASMSGRMSHNVYPPSPNASSVYLYGYSNPFLRPGMSASGMQGAKSGTGSIPSTPRGPPRKPKQSGHALWVGNLPSGTVISALKDHFSRDARTDIESVFLISKSNCAFVNYRTEAACAAAMARFHDSRFQGVRLVCRLRRNSASIAGTGAPTGPAALMPAIAHSQTAFEAIQQNREVSSYAEDKASAESYRIGEPDNKVANRYFVMKSLTVEDMELSVRNKIWATQSHNEEGLNRAYESSENVYLIFSANKSGEYFGVARMASPITDETAAGLDWAPRGETLINDPDIPRSIPTAATEWAPKGRIIDDSARGTIFWEADPEDEDLAPLIDQEVNDPSDTNKAEQVVEAEQATLSGEAQAFGKPFKIEWVATNRLPFYRTRGLRNPWNANREVKIARDGTEIETNVGRRLLHMFQNEQLQGDFNS